MKAWNWMMPTSKPSPSSSKRHWTRIQQSDAQVTQLAIKIFIHSVMVKHLSHWPTIAITSYLSLPNLFFVAEKFLESVEGNQNYPLLLLTLLEKSQDNVIRVCAAVTFKNFIKRNWRIVSLTMRLVDTVSLPLRGVSSCTQSYLTLYVIS